MTPLELLALVAGVLIAAVPAIWAINRAWAKGFDAGYVKAKWDPESEALTGVNLALGSYRHHGDAPPSRCVFSPRV